LARTWLGENVKEVDLVEEGKKGTGRQRSGGRQVPKKGGVDKGPGMLFEVAADGACTIPLLTPY